MENNQNTTDTELIEDENNNTSSNTTDNENDTETTNVDFEPYSDNENEVSLSSTLSEINYKLDTIIYFQEHSYSLSIITVAVVSFVFVCVLMYKFIAKFVEY